MHVIILFMLFIEIILLRLLSKSFYLGCVISELVRAPSVQQFWPPPRLHYQHLDSSSLLSTNLTANLPSYVRYAWTWD